MKKVVIITGVTGTLGKWFVKKYRDTYTIVGIARKPPHTAPEYNFISWDVHENSHNTLVGQVLAEHNRIDVLINNAVYSHWDHLPAIPYTDFVHQLAVNVAAPLALSNACYHQFWSQRQSGENKINGRCVIQVSSIAGINDYLGYGQGTYAASKAALLTLTRHMASDYEKAGVAVNALAANSFPSLISTESVCEGLESMLRANYTGKTLVMDKNKNYML